MSGRELMVGGRPLSSLRVVDLKEELEKRGLSKSGSKKDLSERLKVHLQIEKHREGASRDEGQLPNISMQEKLAEQNPFIRDYFASQAELYHSQKVVKKLYEEETRKESEASSASADEGCDSPIKEKKGVSSSERSKVRKLVQHFEIQSKENSEDIQKSSKASKTEEGEKSLETVEENKGAAGLEHPEKRITRRSAEAPKSSAVRETRRSSAEKPSVKEMKLPVAKDIAEAKSLKSPIQDTKLQVKDIEEDLKSPVKEVKLSVTTDITEDKQLESRKSEDGTKSDCATESKIVPLSPKIKENPVLSEATSESCTTEVVTTASPIKDSKLQGKSTGEDLKQTSPIKEVKLPVSKDIVENMQLESRRGEDGSKSDRTKDSKSVPLSPKIKEKPILLETTLQENRKTEVVVAASPVKDNKLQIKSSSEDLQPKSSIKEVKLPVTKDIVENIKLESRKGEDGNKSESDCAEGSKSVPLSPKIKENPVVSETTPESRTAEAEVVTAVSPTKDSKLQVKSMGEDLKQTSPVKEMKLPVTKDTVENLPLESKKDEDCSKSEGTKDSKSVPLSPKIKEKPALSEATPEPRPTEAVTTSTRKYRKLQVKSMGEDLKQTPPVKEVKLPVTKDTVENLQLESKKDEDCSKSDGTKDSKSVPLSPKIKEKSTLSEATPEPRPTEAVTTSTRKDRKLQVKSTSEDLKQTSAIKDVKLSVTKDIVENTQLESRKGEDGKSDGTKGSKSVPLSSKIKEKPALSKVVSPEHRKTEVAKKRPLREIRRVSYEADKPTEKAVKSSHSSVAKESIVSEKSDAKNLNEMDLRKKLGRAAPHETKRKRFSSSPVPVSAPPDENEKAELELHVNTTEMDIDVDEPKEVSAPSRISTTKISLKETSSILADRSRRFHISRDKFQPQKEPKKSESSRSSSESGSPGITASRQVSVRTEEMDDEALDYGDEEKAKSEPEKFNWSGRILRLKNKQVVRGKERKWRKDPNKKSSVFMDNEYYQTLYSDVKPVAVNELKLEEKSPPRVERKIEIIRKISLDLDDNDINPTREVEDLPITRKVSIVPIVEEDEKELTPPRNSPTQFIVVTNLVRPFTLPQLKNLLQRTGNIVDIWVDKIKSKCIAKFEKEEDALETRAALHGVKWPATNSKPLVVDYSTQGSLDEHKAKDSGESKANIEKPKVAQSHPVREWDMGKKSRSRSPNRIRRRSRSASRDRKRAKRSHSPNRRRNSRTPTQDRKRGADPKETEPSGKALDELFRKTVATPSIYWLPLTPQQIAEKEDLRRRRMQERERRIAELNKLRPR